MKNIQEYHDATKELDLLNDRMIRTNEELNMIEEIIKEKKSFFANMQDYIIVSPE